MPIVSRLFKKNNGDNNKDYNAETPELNSDDIQINDFSENMDLNGLGDLLGGGIPTSNNNFAVTPDLAEQREPESPKPEKPKKTLNIVNLLDAVAGKFKNKKRNGEISDLPKENQPADPNYVSDTVSFVDYDVSTQDNTSEPPIDDFSLNLSNEERENSADNFNIQAPESAENDVYAPPNSSGESVDFNVQAPPSEEFARDNNVYVPPYYSGMPNNEADMPVSYNVYEPQPTENFPVTPLNAARDLQVAEDAADIHIDFDDLHVASIGNSSDEFNAQEEDAGRQIEAELHSEPRRHDIMGAFRAKIEQFCKRLPSFKPREYTIPEPTYEAKDDHIKSPSLVADIEKIIEKQSDLGDVSREYEEMRQYIRSVNENIRLSRDEIAVPENINEVYAAQNELFDMINQISLQNEQQRSQIGVYEKREEEDPYNYRGINDNRQNYSDVDTVSFSVSSEINFESEEKISPNRFVIEQQYNEQMYGTQFEDDFDNDVDNDNYYVSEDNSIDIDADDFDLDNLDTNDFDVNQQDGDSQINDSNSGGSFDDKPRNWFKRRRRERSNVDYQ